MKQKPSKADPLRARAFRSGWQLALESAVAKIKESSTTQEALRKVAALKRRFREQ